MDRIDGFMLLILLYSFLVIFYIIFPVEFFWSKVGAITGSNGILLLIINEHTKINDKMNKVNRKNSDRNKT